MHETRQRIIEFLKEKRQATVEELATAIDLTPMMDVVIASGLSAASAYFMKQSVARSVTITVASDAIADTYPNKMFSIQDKSIFGT